MSDVRKTNYLKYDCGMTEKLSAHINKDLHRAFSVFVHDGKGNMLIQKRAVDKYHSGGLWTNACCSHPLTDNVREEAKERMKQELGFYCDIEYVDEFVYFADFPNGVCEYELDEVYVGVCSKDTDIHCDISEVEEIMWIDTNELMEDVCKNPTKYTRWFITALYMVVRYLGQDK